jgi:hypothetical protein
VGRSSASEPWTLEHAGRRADAVRMFRARILPAIIAIWGAVIVLRMLLTGTGGSGAYAAGGLFAGLLGLVMVVAGVRALLRS